jgi:hypothetical protein
MSTDTNVPLGGGSNGSGLLVVGQQMAAPSLRTPQKCQAAEIDVKVPLGA